MKNLKLYFIIYLLIFSIQDINASTGMESVTKADNANQMVSNAKMDSLNVRSVESKIWIDPL
jgi:hypothetical protein